MKTEILVRLEGVGSGTLEACRRVQIPHDFRRIEQHRIHSRIGRMTVNVILDRAGRG